MRSFKKIIAVGMVAVTALTSSVVSMAAAPVAKVYADEVETATYSYGDLEVDWNKFKGNYVYLRQYTKSDAKKEKATYILTREYFKADYMDDGNSNYFFTYGNFNKETYWKVFDETMKEDDVKLITIPAQSKGGKIALKDVTKDHIEDFFSIKINGSEVKSAEDLDNIGVYIEYETSVDFGKYYNNGGRYFNKYKDEDENGIDDVIEYIREIASAGGGTIYYKYTEKDSSVGWRPFSAKQKFKIPAAAKAPKITIDYVNGTYKLPNKSEYVILAVDQQTGAIGELDSATMTAVDAKAKTNVISVDDIFKNGVKDNILVSGATQAAIYVRAAANGKKFASQPVILKVDSLITPTTSGAISLSGSAIEVKDFKVLVDGADAATIEKSKANNAKDNEVVIKAIKDIQFSTDGKNWTNVKKNKSSKPIAATENASIYIKSLGNKKEETFVSAPIEIKIIKIN